MTSARYAVTVSVLLAIALVPTFIHSYVGARIDDGLVTQAISSPLIGLVSERTDRRAQWVEEIYDSVDWIERRYTGADGSNVRLFVARSYNLKRLYHHPELGVARGIDLHRPVVMPLPELNGASVYVLTAQTGKGIVAYTLLYDDELISDPIALQVRSSLEQIFNAKKPMTLFLVYDQQAPPEHHFTHQKLHRCSVQQLIVFENKHLLAPCPAETDLEF